MNVKAIENNGQNLQKMCSEKAHEYVAYYKSSVYLCGNWKNA